MKKQLDLLRQFSVPLICGVLVALVWANADPAGYDRFIHCPLLCGLSLQFITNDLFMVFFFGIAAVEITLSCLSGGDLNPPAKAINPLIATVGGIAGPAIIYLALNRLVGTPELYRGWGIPTATDIAFAWLAARTIFGRNHPAVTFLLLLAVADDAVGLGIIAVFYTNPLLPPRPLMLLITVAGCGAAWAFRRLNVRSYWPYLLFGGGASWAGLFLARLHPALALVFVIPFIPHTRPAPERPFEHDIHDLSPLARFERQWRLVVDFGMFLFGLVNAGVELTCVGTPTWLVLASLIIGKTLGIFLFALAAAKAGYPLPRGVTKGDLLVVGIVAGVGFTVALFVAGEAFIDPVTQGAAKMGALLSFAAALLAGPAAKLVGVRKLR